MEYAVTLDAGSTNCQFSERRSRAREAELCGVDFVEYCREPGPRLFVHFFGRIPPGVSESAFRIEGGRRIRDVAVLSVIDVEPWGDGETRVTLELDKEGDFAPYSLRVVDDCERLSLDPLYASVQFTFKLDCPGQGDCVGPTCENDAAGPMFEPGLDYLAKDYASFRQLLLDRLSLTLPQWLERHVPDVGLTLVELMAYVGDQLSYQQDAVATEAYVGTARKRTSVRRHARLVDYRMHEGCNARTWVTLCSDQDVTWRTSDVVFFAPAVERHKDGLATGTWGATAGEVFLPLTDEPQIAVRAALGRIRIHTWGGEECCLPRGATRATLVIETLSTEAADAEELGTKDGASDRKSKRPTPRAEELPLAVGDVLLLEEVLGPRTGLPEHADPAHRHAVRLTSVVPVDDPLLPVDQPRRVMLLEVTWDVADALPFSLCLSTLDPAHGCAPIRDICVARGNVVLVDHGRWVEADLGCVEVSSDTPPCEKPGRPTLVDPKPQPFAPVLPEHPLVHAAPLEGQLAFDAHGHALRVPLPASRTLLQRLDDSVAQVLLTSEPCCGETSNPQRTVGYEITNREGESRPRCARCGHVVRRKSTKGEACPNCGLALEVLNWQPKLDLLSSDGEDTHFAVEVEDDGRARVRFGDGTYGRAPEPGQRFGARYRIGEPLCGNVPAEAIQRVLVLGESGGLNVRVRNPLPAVGGTAPESVDVARELAPVALRSRRERAVVAEDYAELALRDQSRLQRTAAALRWTGSWYEAYVGIDALGGQGPSSLSSAVERSLERYRRMGHDVRVDTAKLVPLKLVLDVCADPAFLREQVGAEVRRALVPGPDGQGLFHPDRLTFGQSLALSQIVRAVLGVPGVTDVRVRAFERLFEPSDEGLDSGELRFHPLEIPCLSGDASQPEDGALRIVVRGGR